jgi:hypothetical protein
LLLLNTKLSIEHNYQFLVKPRIDRKNLTIQKAKVGAKVFLDVDVTGEPVPEITWTLMGKEVTTKDNVTIKNIDYNTKFTIENGQRKSSGKYKITATNQHGKDEEFVEIVFLGRPSKPMGPLEAFGITKDSCKLKWRPPEDDGGLPITGYIVEKMDKATGKWAPVCRTEGDKTECPVKGLQEGHEYMFRVKAVNDEGESEPLETNAAIKIKDPFGM